MTLTGREKADIEKWRNGLKDNILLSLSIKDDEAGHRIDAFCDELADLVPEITLIKINENDTGMSEIKVKSNISFHAVPVAKELGPFLNALSSSASLPENISGELQLVLASITTPAMLKVYISPHCSFCPQVVTRCLAIARLNPAIQVSVIDGSLSPEQAAKDKIRSVPTLILDNSFRWTGLVEPEELIQVIAQRDSDLPGVETLKNIIHDRRAEEVVEMMVARREVFPAFLELLTDLKWSVRLGAMAAYEYLAEKSPGLCHKANVDLCNRFPKMEKSIQGDIIYLLGESGDKSVIPFLNSIIKGNFAREVVEAAVDALNNSS